MQTKKKTFGISLFCREQKVGKDGKAPVEVTITTGGKKASFQLPDRFIPSEFRRMRDSSRTNDVVRLCSEVRLKLMNFKDRHPDADSIVLKDYYLNGDPSEGLLKKRVLVRDLCDSFLKGQLEGTPDYEKFKTTFNRFKEAYGSRGVVTITTADLKTFLMDLRDKEHFADGTRKNYYKRLRRLFAYAYEMKVIETNPASKLKMTFADKEPVFLTKEELELLINARLGSPCLERAKEAFLFMCGSGLEYSDVKGLTEDDFKVKAGHRYIQKQRVKTGVTYTAILVGEAPTIFRKYKGRIPLPKNQVINRYLKMIAKEVGIKKNITTLTARHTYATLLYSGYYGNKIPTEVLRECLGHRQLKHTLVYASLTEDAHFAAFKGVY